MLIVMTYNILNGAGVDTLFPGNKEWVERQGYPGNRLQAVLEVIETADPAIIGIQEAHQWEIGNPCVAAQVADELGMNYFIGESIDPSSGFASVVLFTKFDIIDAESYGTQFTRAALRAELMLSSGQSMHVFVVHLDSTSAEIRMRELMFLVDEMSQFTDGLTVLMGDMNFLDKDYAPYDSQSAILRKAGWCHPLSASQDIDQVWTSPVLEPYVQLGPEIPYALTSGASDHRPVVVKVGLP